jgi:hypothetical protein
MGDDDILYNCSFFEPWLRDYDDIFTVEMPTLEEGKKWVEGHFKAWMDEYGLALKGRLTNVE